MSFVKDVWYGQRSLGETYWFWGVFIGSIVVGLGGGFVAGSLVVAMGSQFPFLLLLALMIPQTIWQVVGNWRSATNHPSGWATVVKVITVLGIPYAVYTWVELLSRRSILE